ncbi:MAG: bifunctional folylpolyglutamate synthase/dihydrofolate synthase [Bacteroidaceae bacterium]|nr:bifunctional folylpolyglutamate synthase/dihydrofolate synthase [Bacteroidaceae bacterium]
MNYTEAIDYLYNAAPLFQNIGAGAYKEGLSNTHFIDDYYGHPHTSYRTIHVAGTNGKGSVSHTLAAILQASGYRVGLYTSPHLVDFRERIRVNGEMISEERVVQFVEEDCPVFGKLSPSFFELVTGLAFKYFQEQKVDVAVIEVGMGGRLDCTNIIRPILSIITNVSFDHTQFLGATLPEIAFEKAGVIKDGVPAVVGETNGYSEVRKIFERKALECKSKIAFADEMDEVTSTYCKDGFRMYHTRHFGTISGQLEGNYQVQNTATILAALGILAQRLRRLSVDHIREGFASCQTLTHFCGRWQTLGHEPLVVCDAGHNVAGISQVVEQLRKTPHRHLYIIIGMVSDKDIDGVLSLLPQDAFYIFTQASVRRALPVETFQAEAEKHGLHGISCPDVMSAYRLGLEKAEKDDMLFVGGSCYIVADLLKGLFGKI